MPTEHEYHALPFVSQSSLKVFLRNPGDYKHCFVDRTISAEAETAAMGLGTLVHSLLLEPDATTSRFYVLDEEDRPNPSMTMAAAVNKVWKANLQQQVREAGKLLVPRSLFGQAQEMREACLQHALASSYLNKTGEHITVFTEQVILWKHPESELELKSKLDRMIVNTSSCTCDVLDYKTTSASSLKEFGWSVRKYGYDTQAVFYEDAARAFLEEQYPDVPFLDWHIRVLFIPQRVTMPYQVLGVTQLDAVTLETARDTYIKALQELEGCLHTGTWYEEDQKVTVLQLSAPPEETPPSELELP